MGVEDKSWEKVYLKRRKTKTEDETVKEKSQQVWNMESRTKKKKKTANWKTILLFHSLLRVVRIMGTFSFKNKAYGTEVILQCLIVTVNFDIKPHQPPILSAAELEYKLLTSEGLMGKWLFLQDKFAERQFKNGLVGPENQGSFNRSKKDLKVYVIFKSCSSTYLYFITLSLIKHRNNT